MSLLPEADHDADPFRQLSRRAWVSNRRRADELAALVAVLATGQDGTSSARLSLDGDRDRALSLSHEILGSAGTFGYSEVSELARRMELLLSGLPAGAEELVEMAAQIQQALERSPLLDE